MVDASRNILKAYGWIVFWTIQSFLTSSEATQLIQYFILQPYILFVFDGALHWFRFTDEAESQWPVIFGQVNTFIDFLIHFLDLIPPQDYMLRTFVNGRTLRSLVSFFLLDHVPRLGHHGLKSLLGLESLALIVVDLNHIMAQIFIVCGHTVDHVSQIFLIPPRIVVPWSLLGNLLIKQILFL